MLFKDIIPRVPSRTDSGVIHLNFGVETGSILLGFKESMYYIILILANHLPILTTYYFH